MTDTTLEQRVTKLEMMLKKLLQGPIATHKNELVSIREELAELKDNVSNIKKAPKARTRKPLSMEDYNAVMGALNAGGSLRATARDLGIPESTVRKYRDMEPDDVAELPWLELDVPEEA